MDKLKIKDKNSTNKNRSLKIYFLKAKKKKEPQWFYANLQMIPNENLLLKEYKVKQFH